MYTRVPQKSPRPTPPLSHSDRIEAIRLPENYSGNAFSSDGQRRQIVADPPPISAPTPEEKHVPHLSPSVSATIPSMTAGPLGYSDFKANEKVEATEIDHHESPYTSKETQSLDNAPPPPTERVKTPSLLSSIFGGHYGENFPFGHGLGGEELLILGIMLAIYLSEERDSELMMLLGILLLAG